MNESTLNKKLFLIVFFAVALFAFRSAMAAQADLASVAPKTVSYKITDGYGEYQGYGTTQLQAASHAREACIQQKISAYENRFGTTPDEDTADLFIDACINR